MHEFSIYGLKLLSNEPIPSLIASPSSPAHNDVAVRFEPNHDGPDRQDERADDWFVGAEGDDEPWLLIRRAKACGDLFVFYPDGISFRLSARGDAVSVWWPDRLTIDDAAVYLLGPVLGILLRLRGEVCLHGSAVEADGAAVGFVGPAGAGKSSTAAALAQRGRRVLSDDMIVLRRDAGRFFVQPGYPSVRLWPATVTALFGSPDAIPPIVRGWEKRHLDLAAKGAYADEPAPLAAVYLLGEGRPLSRTKIEPLSRSRALLDLAANSFAGYLPDDPAMSADRFEALNSLTAIVPVRRLIHGADWGTISDLSDSLREDLEDPAR